MFTVDEFQLIKKCCLPELEKLLQKISISIPNFDGADEFIIYDKLGGEITNKMCNLLKSNSVVEGYTKLLKLGNISYDFSETDNELLDKVVSNKNKILQGGINEKKLIPTQKPIDNFNIKISHTKIFDSAVLINHLNKLQDLLEGCIYVKENLFVGKTEYIRPANFYPMKDEISQLMDYVRSLNLVQVENSSLTVPPENLFGKIQEYSSALVKMKKISQPVSQPEPPKIIFSTANLEKIFEVLEQANKIYKSI